MENTLSFYKNMDCFDMFQMEQIRKGLEKTLMHMLMPTKNIIEANG